MSTSEMKISAMTEKERQVIDQHYLAYVHILSVDFNLVNRGSPVASQVVVVQVRLHCSK